MYEFVTFSIFFFFLQELWVSHFNRIPETYDAYVALDICNKVEFIILCRQTTSLNIQVTF